MFSSRRESITADLRERAARFEHRYGRAPSQAHAGWVDKLARTLGVPAGVDGAVGMTRG